MKKVRRILVLLMTALAVTLLTGCIKFDATMTVNKDGSVDASIVYAINNVFGDSSDIIEESDVEGLEAKGWIISKYDQNGYIGFAMKKNNLSLEEDSDDSIIGSMVGEGSGLTVKGNTYTLDLDIFSGDKISGIIDYGSAIEEAGGSATITIVLPIKPEEQNATSVSADGKTLTWNLLSMNKGDHIYLKVKKPNTTLYVILGAAALVLVVLLLAVLGRRKK